MTTPALRIPATARPRARLRADPLAVALLVAAALGVAALGVALLAARPEASGGPVAARVAIVVDAAGRPGAALAAAERSRAGATPAIRVPWTATEAATDVRYFAAQRYATVVAVGPAARAAARSVAAQFPRTRFVLRARLP